MDIELAIDMMEMAERLDHIVLFSGDGDFRRLVEAVQRKGVRVTVVRPSRSQPPMVADELRRQADIFIDLQDLAQSIMRPPRPIARQSPKMTRWSARDSERARGPAEPTARCAPAWRGSAPTTAPRMRDWHNAPVPAFGPLDARLLIVGLAPGLQGRQPHRPAVHRRLRRRPALRHLAEIRLRTRHLCRACG